MNQQLTAEEYRRVNSLAYLFHLERAYQKATRGSVLTAYARARAGRVWIAKALGRVEYPYPAFPVGPLNKLP